MNNFLKLLLVVLSITLSPSSMGCKPKETTIFINATENNLTVIFDDERGKFSNSIPSGGSSEARINTVDRYVRILDAQTGRELFFQMLPRPKPEHVDLKHQKTTYLITNKGVFLIPVAYWNNWKENLDKIIPSESSTGPIPVNGVNS